MKAKIERCKVYKFYNPLRSDKGELMYIRHQSKGDAILFVSWTFGISFYKASKYYIEVLKA